ncbi:MAG: primosomal protein N' [Chloroflexi bacterium]|nr:primosomal protein N' [Chloroflexota bacterium]
MDGIEGGRSTQASLDLDLGLHLDDDPDGGPGAPGTPGVEGTAEAPRDGPRVRVAIDAAGAAGAHAFTYHVPGRLGRLEPGEAVVVEFGRRQALGIVLGAAVADPGVATKPILDRVRGDGPLLPPLAMDLAAWIAGHYLAPPALVLRAMLPPGLLERLELVAERRPDPAQASGKGSGSEVGGDDGFDRHSALDLEPADVAVMELLSDGAKPVRRLAAPEGRAALLRRLRALRSRGLIDLDWTLLDAGAGPRYVRIGRAATGAGGAATGAGDAATGGRLGSRQLAALGELREAGAAGIPSPELAARHGTSVLPSLVRRGLATVETVEAPRRPLASRARSVRGARPENTSLTRDQVEAVASIRDAIRAADPTPLLLDGVTGSGKTAIYAEALATCLDEGRRALLLVPEIALALPLVDRLRAELDATIALLHSGLGEGERADEWRRIRSGEADIVVGTRLAALAPLDGLGLVVVDEEHDPAYKGDRTPRVQARDVAVELGRLAGAAVVLGSATPAVDTEGLARDGSVRRVRLPVRAAGRPPTIEVVDLREELEAGNRGMLSRALVTALAGLHEPNPGVGRTSTARGGGTGPPAAADQAVLVINRRGSASVVLCRDCGHVQACPDCTRPLVYHQSGVTLRCHHCGRATPLATRCPNCGSARIRYLGGGTERLEREVRDRFPSLRVGRLDRDVVERRGAAARVIDAFAEGAIDVLVGTSLVTKGIDVPAVTLVGVVSADIALNLPDERAAERTYQLLAQAVGRAGRGDRPGHAIIQTYLPDHPAIRAVATGQADAFYDAELDLRRRFGSPPFGRLLKLTVALADRAAAERTADAFADELRARAAADPGRRVTIAGPAPAYIARRADRWRFNVILRGDDPAGLLGEPPGAPWSVDVDPESLL